MSKFSDYVKECKKNDLKYFYGQDLEEVSNKYIRFKHVKNDDEIILVTSNVKMIKDNYVLIVGNNKGVYLKDWTVRKVHNYDEMFNGYAIKLNRNYFKIYTFSSDFKNVYFEKDETFDDLKQIASTQDDTKIAQGWTNN